MINTDYLSLTIVVGDYQVPPANVVLQECNIVMNARQNVPVARLIFADSMGFFHNTVTLSDGMPVEISIGNTKSSAVTYKFRLFMPKNNVGSVGSSVVLILYFDAPLYLSGTSTLCVQNTSAAVIAQIASATGLSSETDVSQDLQAWLPASMRWCQFAHHLAKFGWASNTSAFMLGITETGILRYKNVGAYLYDNTLPVFRLGQLVSDGSFIPVTSWSQIVFSGFNNMRGAYHGAQQNQSYIADSGVKETLTNVQKVKGSQNLYINKDVKASLQDARLFSWSTVDCGNTHPNYNMAKYQNERLLKTVSSKLSVLTMVQTGITLLDRVQVQAFLPSTAGETPQVEVGTSGYYFVLSKTIHAGPEGMYVEKFEFVRDGTNQDLQQTMV